MTQPSEAFIRLSRNPAIIAVRPRESGKEIAARTTDYGDGPGAGQTSIGTFAAISDGKHWQSRPAVMKLLVPLGTRPGAIVTLTATAEEPTHDQ